MKACELEYLGCKISVRADHLGALAFLRDFFSSNFLFREHGTGAPFTELVLTQAPAPKDAAFFELGEQVYLRKSAKEFFTITARKVVEGATEHVRCARSGTVIAFERTRVVAYLPREGFELDVMELVRDLVFKHVERQGTVALHATAVTSGNRAVLIVGEKGAGKTSLALQLVSRGFKLLSGDKTFLIGRNNDVFAKGWPDYPHVGAGTLRAVPDIASRLGVLDECRGLSDDTKLELEPSAFRRVVPHADPEVEFEIAGILFPVVKAGASRLSTATDTADVLSRNIETAFGPTSGWNSFQPRPAGANGELLPAVARKPAWRCEGTDPLPARFVEELKAYGHN